MRPEPMKLAALWMMAVVLVLSACSAARAQPPEPYRTITIQATVEAPAGTPPTPYAAGTVIPESQVGVDKMLGLPGASPADEKILLPGLADWGSRAGLLRGDGTVPLMSQLNWRLNQPAPRRFFVAEGLCHTMSQSGNLESGNGAWSESAVVVWEPQTFARSLRPWIAEVLSGPRELFNYDDALPSAPSRERFGQ